MMPHWSEIVAPPKTRVLRQFAALWLLFFAALAGWRAWHGDRGVDTAAIAAAAIVVGGAGLFYPRAVRWVYTSCMVVTFPVGFVVSHVALAGIFYLVFTPVALVFRAIGRDPLRVRRRGAASHWTPIAGRRESDEYLRQS